MNGSQPILVYRVRCGQKIWTRWLDSEARAWRAAIDHDLAYADPVNGRIYPGPLVWVEIGQRRYPHSRTIPLRQDEHGKPLRALNMPPAS